MSAFTTNLTLADANSAFVLLSFAITWNVVSAAAAFVHVNSLFVFSPINVGAFFKPISILSAATTGLPSFVATQALPVSTPVVPIDNAKELVPPEIP